MAIKCHSGFVHYNMFHNNHCHGGGNNYGSIFNITNNCGGGTSFWGGLGAGLGFGFGNLLGGFFGNMFGGFGNMFGGFGNIFGGFGMGGWGAGLSGLWGGGGAADRDYSEYSSRRSSRSGSCDCGCKGKGNDKDYSAINKFDEEANALLKADKSADNDKKIDALVKKLKDYKLVDDAHKTENETQIKQLIERLQAHRSTPAPVVEGEQGEGDQGNQAKIGGKLISELTVDDIAGITDDEYNNLDDTAKKKLQEKVYELAKDQDKAKQWAQSTTLPSDLRAEAKRSFYVEGYANVTLASLTDDEIKKLKSVIDTSNIADFENIETIDTIKRDTDGKLTSFKMTAKTGTSVTYVTVNVVDGELIFHGAKQDQEYALQKDTDGNYHLMQYAYHKGNGSADVNS